MNKKFLSAILFGALMVTSTGTFVSCKDYDDDIDDLQTQIDSQKSDLSTQVSALESSISNLQSAQSSLQSKIAETQSAAEKAAVEAQAAAVAAAEESLAAAKAELLAAIAEAEKAHAADVEEVKAAIAEAEEAAAAKMAEVSGAIQTLQAFSVTTTETLEALAAADNALQASIAALDAKIAEQAVLVGKNTVAINAQIEALENYKKSADAAIAGNADAIAKIEKELAAMKTAADAQAKALTDYIAANNASVKNNADAIETLAADIKALQEGQLTEAKVSEIAAQVTKELEGKLDLLSAIYNKMITNVSLVKVLGEDDFINLNLVSAKAVRTWTFGEGMEGAIEFEKDAKETFEGSFVIRVTPSNASVDEGTLQLVNSQLGNLDELIDIVSIKPYTELITSSRGVSENGLWTVTVKLNKEYSEDAYSAASQVKVNGDWKNIVYAVKLTDADNADRAVVSEYGITLGSQAKEALRTLNFNVNTTNVAEIHNRWNGTSGSTTLAVTEASGDNVPFLEKTWNMTKDDKGNSIYAPWAAPVYVDNQSTTINDINVINDETDKRNALAAYSVKAGEAFTVNFNNIANSENIRGFYVALDEECAVESAPSEIRAWEAYKVEGLGEVSTTGSISLTIPEAAGAEGDYIGFRVFAVNYDGSLVDPDGKAFYVYVGETDKGISTLKLTISDDVVVPLATTTISNQDAFSTAKWGRAMGGTYSLVVKDANGTEVDVVNWTNFKFTYVDDYGNDAVVALFADASKLISTADITKVAKVELTGVAADVLKDGMTYTATITAKNANSGNVAVATVKFAKVLPGFPTAIKPYTGQVVNGNLMVFPYAVVNTEGKATSAAYLMTSSWHGIANYTTNAQGNVVDEVTAESFVHNVTSPKLAYDSESNILSAPVGYLNPANSAYLTKFPVAVKYNYGPISYRQVNGAWTSEQDWVTSWGQSLTIQLGNYVNECSYAMNTNLSIVYPGAVGKTSKFLLSNIIVKDWYNTAVSLLNIKNQVAGTKEAKFFAEDFKVEFLTGDNFDIVDEYYEFAEIKLINIGSTEKPNNQWHVTMTSKSDAATGTPVTTKVRLTFKDKFGNSIVKVVSGSFTMNFQN